jgi:hypothetical protein
MCSIESLLCREPRTEPHGLDAKVTHSVRRSVSKDSVLLYDKSIEGCKSARSTNRTLASRRKLRANWYQIFGESQNAPKALTFRRIVKFVCIVSASSALALGHQTTRPRRSWREFGSHDTGQGSRGELGLLLRMERENNDGDRVDFGNFCSSRS